MRLQAGERRAQLVRGIGDEALLVAARRRHFGEKAVQRGDQRPGLFRRRGGVNRPEVTRRTRLDLLGKARQRFQSPLHAVPDDDHRGERDQEFREQALAEEDRAQGARASPSSLRRGSCKRSVRTALAPTPRGPLRRDRLCCAPSDRPAARVDPHPRRSPSRQGSPRGSRCCRTDRCAAPAPPRPARRTDTGGGDAHVRAKRQARYRRVPGRRPAWQARSTGSTRPRHRARGAGDRGKKQAQQVRPEAAGASGRASACVFYLYSSSM